VDSSTLSLTLELEGGGGGWWYMPCPGRFTPGKTQYPLYRRLGGHQSQSERVRKISPLPGFTPQTVQPVTSRYTVPAHSAQAYICSTQLHTYTIYNLKMTVCWWKPQYRLTNYICVWWLYRVIWFPTQRDGEHQWYERNIYANNSIFLVGINIKFYLIKTRNFVLSLIPTWQSHKLWGRISFSP